MTDHEKIKEIVKREGGSKALSQATGINIRTCESWEQNEAAKSSSTPRGWFIKILDEWLLYVCGKRGFSKQWWKGASE